MYYGISNDADPLSIKSFRNVLVDGYKAARSHACAGSGPKQRCRPATAFAAFLSAPSAHGPFHSIHFVWLEYRPLFGILRYREIKGDRAHKPTIFGTVKSSLASGTLVPSNPTLCLIRTEEVSLPLACGISADCTVTFAFTVSSVNHWRARSVALRYLDL